MLALLLTSCYQASYGDFKSSFMEVLPSAAVLASLSASSFPFIPVWPADHLKVSLNLELPLLSSSCLASCRRLATRCCPNLFILDLIATRAAWLLMLSTLLTLLLLLVFMRWSPIIIPTSSTLYTVCCFVVPKCIFSMQSGLPSHLRIAAAPTLPLCTNPSEYTLIFSTVHASALFESSLFEGMSMCTTHKPIFLGCIHTRGIFSISFGLIPNMLVRVCRGDLCLLI
jgi:hypothetical protein